MLSTPGFVVPDGRSVKVDYPDPGVVDYWWSVGVVVCSGGREKVPVEVVQRVEDGRPGVPELSMCGIRWGVHEVDELVTALRDGMSVLVRHAQEVGGTDEVVRLSG
jgi:hypothetical protein